MKHIKSYKSFDDSINEGWKDNLMAALTLASSVAFAGSDVSTYKDDDYQTELVIDKDKDFYAACFQACQEMKSGDLTIDQMGALLEAQLYFQNIRDGKKSPKLSPEGKVAAKVVMKKVITLPEDEIQRLVDLGHSGKVKGDIVGK